MAEEGSGKKILPIVSATICIAPAGLLGCVGAIVFIAAMLAMVSLGGAEDLNEEPEVTVEGDVEFWVTHYDPALGGINGSDCGGAAVDVGLVTNNNSSCLTEAERRQYKNSPTGYAIKYAGEILGTGEFAVPQVNESEIPVPLVHNKVKQQARIILPGYNNNLPAVVGDHFATSITKPNRLDMLCHKTKYGVVARYWNEHHLILDTASGFNGGSKIKGKIVGRVIRG